MLHSKLEPLFSMAIIRHQFIIHLFKPGETGPVVAPSFGSTPSKGIRSIPTQRCFTPFREFFEDPETYESRWTFSVAGKEASQSFLLVGTVKEPRVGHLALCSFFCCASASGI